MAELLDPIEPMLLPEAAAGAAAHPERALKVVDLYKAAIGPRHQAYYLKQFARQEAGPGLRLSWHWPAFFSALNWFAFRKMWGWAAGYAAMLALLAVATWQGAAAFGLGRIETLAWGAGGWLGVSLVVGLLANALYHRHCMQLIHRVLVSGVDRETAADVLAEQNSSNQRWSGQLLVNVALLLFVPALATFAPWNGLDAWEWLTEAPAREQVPEPGQPTSAVADGERRVLPPGTATPTLKITSAETAQAATPAVTLALLPATTPAPDAAQPAPSEKPNASEPVATPSPLVPPPVSEAWASAQTGWVLPGDPPPDQRPASEAAKPLARANVAKSEAVVAVAPKAPAKAASTSFGVQVGIFAQPANVTNVMTQLKAQGLPVYSDPITMAGQPRTRVRVGPYSARDNAQRVAAQITDLGLPAVVVPLPASAAPPRR